MYSQPRPVQSKSELCMAKLLKYGLPTLEFDPNNNASQAFPADGSAPHVDTANPLPGACILPGASERQPMFISNDKGDVSRFAPKEQVQRKP